MTCTECGRARARLLRVDAAGIEHWFHVSCVRRFFDNIRAACNALGGTCQGWNYHVFTLGADKCSVCGKSRERAKRRGER